MTRAVDVPFAKNSADHRRALQPAFERCATPLTMGTAICFTPSTRVRGGVPLGAPTRLSCAGAGVSSGLTAAVKVRMGKSKLRKIEANTVHAADMLNQHLTEPPMARFAVRCAKQAWVAPPITAPFHGKVSIFTLL